MVCVYMRSLTAVLINDAIPQIFECPILSGVINMHSFCYRHSEYMHYLTVLLHIIFFLFYTEYCSSQDLDFSVEE